ENEPVTIDAVNHNITSPERKTLAGPLNFSLAAGERAVRVGRSGSGKSSLLNVLSGFLSDQGSLRMNGVELRDLSPDSWRQHL
ncbi:ATP-binding cassette domain-containing protein, partial [Salmonella enterica subsp. enterica serovar Infantis]